jgi:hypothetical protein
MDGGHQYFKKKNHLKIPIVPHVKFLWIDGKWCQHDVTMVVAN